MAFSNFVGKIMKHREERNKATRSQVEVTGRGKRHSMEIKQCKRKGAE